MARIRQLDEYGLMPRAACILVPDVLLAAYCIGGSGSGRARRVAWAAKELAPPAQVAQSARPVEERWGPCDGGIEAALDLHDRTRNKAGGWSLRRVVPVRVVLLHNVARVAADGGDDVARIDGHSLRHDAAGRVARKVDAIRIDVGVRAQDVADDLTEEADVVEA